MVTAPLLVAIASPRRREILRLVWRQELAAGDIHAAMPDVTFGAVSQQLRVLVDAGLIEPRVDGRNRYYRVSGAIPRSLAKTLEEMWDDALWRLKLKSELEQTRRGPKPDKPKRSKS